MNASGNPTGIVTEQDGSTHYTCTRFGYAGNEQAVTFILGEEWDWDGDPEHDPTNYEVTYAREFRYDSGRARYLVRELDPEDLKDGGLLSIGGLDIRILSAVQEHLASPIIVYNLSVEPRHTYFIPENRVWVHNEW